LKNLEINLYHTFNVFAFAAPEIAPKRSARFLIVSDKSGVFDADFFFFKV
jgi:hypothetical protein